MIEITIVRSRNRGWISAPGGGHIEAEAIWDHCFESVPSHWKCGAWLKKSKGARTWMNALLTAHGAKIFDGVPEVVAGPD